MQIHDRAKKLRREPARVRASAPATPREVHIPKLFQIVAQCRDESQQRALFERLTAEGFKCRVLTL